MSDPLIAILLIVAIIVIVYYLVKKFTIPLINTILGNIVLLLLKFTSCHAMDGQTGSRIRLFYSAHLCYWGCTRNLHPRIAGYLGNHSLNPLMF